MKKNLLVSFIYPSAISFLRGFISNLTKQTTSNFDVLFFNDGVIDLDSYVPDSFIEKYNLKVVDVAGTPSFIRFNSFHYLRKEKREKIIFQDCDDFMSKNRVKSVLKFLDNFSVVVNDLTLFKGNNEIINNNVWRRRLGEKFEFDYNFIIDKNIIGFGNTSIRAKLLDMDFSVPKFEIMAPDWFLFYQLLFLQKVTAIFQSEAITFYRQHTDNLVGLGRITQDSISHALKIKENHYMALIDVGINMRSELQKVQEQMVKIQHQYSVQSPKTYHFWWEESKFIQ